MRGVAIVLSAFFLLALESPLLHELSVVRYAPDIILVTVIYLGLTTRFELGIALALVLGLFKDGFILSSPIGLYMEISALAFVASHRLSQRLALRGPMAVILLTIVFSMGASALELGLSAVFDRTFGIGGRGPASLLASSLPQALITAPFAPALFWLYDRLDGLTSRQGTSVYM